MELALPDSVKARNYYVFRDALSITLKRVHDTYSHRVVCADDRIRKFVTVFEKLAHYGKCRSLPEITVIDICRRGLDPVIIKDLLEDHDTLFGERVIPESAEHVEPLCTMHFDDMFYHRFEGRAVFEISIDAALNGTLESDYRNALLVAYFSEPADYFPGLDHLAEDNDAG